MIWNNLRYLETKYYYSAYPQVSKNKREIKNYFELNENMACQTLWDVAEPLFWRKIYSTIMYIRKEQKPLLH